MTSFSYPYRRDVSTGLTSAVRIIDTNNHAAFEDECFRCWLNIIDARIGYDSRKQWATVAQWRALFNAGECENDAIRSAWGETR